MMEPNRSVEKKIEAAANLINNSPSVRAQIRRFEGGRARSEVTFWSVATRLGLLSPSDGPTQEVSWRDILAGLVYLGNLHSRKVPFGSALYRSGFREERLARLLADSGTTLGTEIVGTARYLASKGQRVDWAGAAKLLLATHGEHLNDERRKIAIAYFETERSLKRSST